MTPERYQRVKALFQSAVELAPAKREAYLTAETGEDAALRSEVDRMLLYASGTGLLDKPAWRDVQLENRLDSGSRLGPYEILAEAGAGGMGRVYRARDTRLGRIVAIKVLSAEYNHRVQLEARAVSALNHPHVCALYDIGDQEGMAYLVMEYVEGESLAARIARGPLPYDSVLRYGSEVAGALAAAHAQCIVHRDLKPANIMITESGAKVLDFGVAQMARGAEAAENGEAPSEGVAGTVAYMSPSQLNGNPADARSDIFALGLVLHEMATGVRPSREAPEPSPHIPAPLAALIHRCLRLDTRSRIQTMEEVRGALDDLRSKATPRSRRRWAKGLQESVLVAMAVAIAVLGWRVAMVTPSAPHQPAATPKASVAVPIVPAEKAPAMVPVKAVLPVRTAPAMPPSLVTLAAYEGLKRDPSFSPDGTNVAFSWHTDPEPGYGVYVKPLNGEASLTALTNGNLEDWGPAWSPDGRRIAFRRSGSRTGIFWVPSTGGPATQVASIARQAQYTLPQMSWSHDGKWIAAPDRGEKGGTQLYLFGIESGEKRALTINRTGTDHAPAFSPDGRSLAYASCSDDVFPCDVYVIDLSAGLQPKALRRITDVSMYLRGVAWLPDGKSLVYSAGSKNGDATSLWRVSVDPPGLPERIDMAGDHARHPTISPKGELLAYTRLGNWNLMMIQHFR